MYDLGVDDGLVAVGYSNDDVSDLVRGTIPQHRVTKLAPAGAPGEEELAKLFEASMKIYWFAEQRYFNHVILTLIMGNWLWEESIQYARFIRHYGAALQ